MAKKTFTVLTLGAVAVFLLMTAGCVSKKRLRAVEQENAQQLAQANSRIDDLVQKKDALDKSLTEAQSALAGAQNENKQLAAGVASLKDQIATLESEKSELDKALAAGKETEASYQKKVRGLNGSISALKKKVEEAEALIAAKDAEIASLKTNEAALKAAADEQAQKMAALNTEKSDLSTLMDKTVSGKNKTILILEILLALAVILAIVGFVRGRKRGSAG